MAELQQLRMVGSMSFSPPLKWSVLLLLLVFTLGWKWAVISYGGASDPDEPEEKAAAREVAAFLTRNRFSVAGPQEFVYGMQLLEATTGLCRMRVALSASRGWHRDLIQNMTSSADRVFVVFRGNIYPEQPMWRTVPDFLWSRFLAGLGLSVNPSPVVTVIAQPSCEAESLPWNKLL